VGLKPGYGAVSRHGLAAYASSMESIGVLADTVARCRDVFAVIRGGDPRDQLSRDAPEAAPPLHPAGGGAKKIGVLGAEAVVKAMEEAAKRSGNKELEAAARACVAEEEVRRGFDLARERLSALGHTLVDIEVPNLATAGPAFYAIATAEASSNLSRFDGIRFGARPAYAENPDDLVDKAREAGFGPEVKLQILLGTHVLRSGFQERYFRPAQRIRALIKASFESLLGDSEYKEQAKLDAILMPVFPGRAFGIPLIGTPSPFAQKAAGLYNCCTDLAGIPALAFPVSLEGSPSLEGVPSLEGGLPVGVQLAGRAQAEEILFEIAEGYERRHPFPRPEGFKPFWS
jgi:aspartyl-tRNA(Asn)/glutamyl-tRNA(Gln) amidotransferase subunit A